MVAIPSAAVLVSDFDGTMTRHDFYQLVRARWWDESQPDPWQDYLAGRITHFEALNRFFGRIRADETTLRQLADSMELDATLPAALQRLHDAGWSVVFASAGCEWYIRHLLRAVRTPFVLHANPGRLTSEQSLQMVLPTSSPFYSPTTGIDKPAVVRDALARSSRVAFAGDGPPDVGPAKLVPAERRFARGHLAAVLGAEGEGFRPLENWEKLADRLLASA